jgi:uncharacterized protein
MSPLDESTLASLPIFPLPDAVLFPGALLPLRVFEPRYLEMTRHVLAGDRIMAIARLRPGYQNDYHGRPPVFPVASVAYVIDDNQFPDGQYHIVVRGLARIQIADELPPNQAYRRVRARILEDEIGDADDVRRRHDALLATCDRLANVIGEAGPSLQAMARSMMSAGGCADVLASALVAAPDERQAMLENLNVVDRLEAVQERVAALLIQMGPSGSMPN